MADSKKSEDEKVVQELPDVVEAEIVEDLDDKIDSDDDTVTKWYPGLGPMLLGGVVTAAIGFGAAQYTQSNGWPFPQDNTEIDALTTLVEIQKSQSAKLKTDLASLQAELAKLPKHTELTELGVRLAEKSKSIEDVSGKLDLALRRLTDLENRPIPEVGATVEAVQTYERELTAMRQMFEEELTRIDAAQKQAAKAGEATTEQANNALKRASVARINAAIESGIPFEEAILGLVSMGMNIPDSLISVSNSGVPTLAALQEQFPEAARAALKAAVTPDSEPGNISKIGALLKTQLGARSLEPQEGNDANAVLSRAEDALRNDKLAAAISELAGLSEPAMAQLTIWIEQANIRLTSVMSVTALNAELNK